MKKTVILLGICVSLIRLPDARGQSIGPSTLNATGGTHTIGSNVCDWSIGEMTMVSDFYSAAVIVTQGVLQNDIMFSGVANVSLTNSIKVFPNPASTVINLQFAAPTQGTLSYRLMDMAGKVITNYNEKVTQGTITEQINISELAVASYALEVYFKTGNNPEEMTTYKIDKLK